MHPFFRANIVFLLTFAHALLWSQSTGQGDGKSTATAQPEESIHVFKPITWGPDNEYKLQFGGETRIRAERRKNYDLDSSDGGWDDDTLGLMRTKFNLELTRGEVFRAFIEMLDGREIDAKREQGQEVFTDLHQLFFDLKPAAKSPWTFRFGRQELDLGRDRLLVESSNWGNLRRSYEGLQAIYETDDLLVNLLLTHPDYFEHKRGDESVTRRRRMRDEEWFWGAYATLKQYKPHTIEAYFLGLNDTEEKRTFNPNRRSENGTYGASNRYTVGAAAYGPLKETDSGKLEYTTQYAYQFGNESIDPIRAHFLRGDLTYHIKRHWKPSVSLVGTWASGDKDPKDGVNESFSQLFGANHSPYGIMDFVRARNLREITLIGRLRPSDKLLIQAELNNFWMDSKTDRGIDAPGEDSMRDESGNSGSELGHEVSLTAEYDYSKRLSFEAGAAYFFPGTAPKAMGADDGASLFYIQTRYRF